MTAADTYGHAGLVENKSGKRWFFKGTRFDLNRLGASEIANDKAYTATFLKARGIPVPAWHFSESSKIRNAASLPEAIVNFVDVTKFPVFVKPNIGQEGKDVVRVGGKDTLWATLERLAKTHDHLLIQEAIGGREFRVVVLDGEILCIIERSLPEVTGDGVRNIADLLGPRGNPDRKDYRLALELAAQGLTPDCIPGRGQRVTLLPVANLSSGGTASIVTGGIPAAVRSTALIAARTLNLRYAGVDLIVPESTEKGNEAVVLEVNAAPGLSNLSGQGPQEAELVEEIYEKVFSTLFERDSEIFSDRPA